MCVFNTLIAHLKNGLAGVRHLVEEFSSCLSPFLQFPLHSLWEIGGHGP